MVKLVYPNLLDSVTLYLPELRHLLTYYINLRRDFFYEIKSSHTCYDHKRPKHQSDIAEIVNYHKIVKTKLCANNKAYNNKKRIIYYINFFVNHLGLEELKPNAIRDYHLEKIEHDEKAYK